MNEAINSPEAKSRRFRPYPKYKDSDVEWLGEIPAHWEITRLKRKASIKYGLGEPPQQHADGLPFIRATNVMRGRIVNHEMQFVDPKDVPWNRDPILRTDDVVVVRSGAYTGDSAIIPAKYDGAIAGYDMVVRPAYCQARFLAWTLLSQYVLQAQIELESLRAAQPHLNAEELGSVLILDLPESEQRAIAAFLDHETAKIDALIEKKERLNELLQEKRTVLITQAVTKGLNPSVPMKDPGVEWIDQIPVHWIGLSLKRWVKIKITDGPHETPALEDEGVDFISAEAVSNGIIDFDHRRGFISQALHKLYCRKCKPVRDDILLCKSGATTGKLAMVEVDFDFSVWSPLALIRADTSTILPKFLALALDSNYVQEQIIRTWSAGTQPNISMGDLEKLFIIAPSIEQQRKILKHLNCQIGGFDAMMEKIREAIDRLKEYRTALISAAVTGKIDVRSEGLKSN
jgi:type I restriction enzyme S subunit